MIYILRAHKLNKISFAKYIRVGPCKQSIELSGCYEVEKGCIVQDGGQYSTSSRAGTLQLTNHSPKGMAYASPDLPIILYSFFNETQLCPRVRSYNATQESTVFECFWLANTSFETLRYKLYMQRLHYRMKGI